MLSNEEKQLKIMKKDLGDIPVPSDLDSYILTGVQLAKQEKQKQKRKTWMTSVAVAAILFLSLFIIRVSPAFASLVSQVPGLDVLVELIRGDEGLKDAIENEYTQAVGLFDSKEGITFTVDQIIADESRMLIFYSITSEKALAHLDVANIEFLDEDGKPLEVGFSYSGLLDGIKEGETVSDTIDINLRNQNMPSEITIKAGVKGAGLGDETWSVTFPVDMEKFTNNHDIYPLDQTVTIEGQKITFKEITVYPTQIAIHVKYDKENTKEIFYFDDLAIIDETGNERASIKNGIAAHHLSDDEMIIYLESNYFTKPKELYLQFSSVRALDKNKRDVVIDLENGVLLTRPNDQIEMVKFNKGLHNIDLTFSIQSVNPFDENRGYQIFEHIHYDDQGNEFEHGGHSTSVGVEEDRTETSLSLPIKNLINSSTVTLKVNDYPTRIEEDIKVKIK